VSRTYDLFVETGPQRKSTNVYVIDLLGCVLFRRTTDQAIADAADEIRAYLRWLHGHGEKVDPEARFETRVKHESHAGGFIGSARLEEDLAPLTAAEVARYARWLEWGREDLLVLAAKIDRKRLDHKPASGRTLRGILEHVLGADKGYVYSVFRTTKSVGDPTNAALGGTLDLRVALREARAAAIERIRAATPEERESVRQGGASTYTLRRCLRSMLGHEWEHRREIEDRLRSAA
jgi:uncharacterized damage-inducible protein DinB